MERRQLRRNNFLDGLFGEVVSVGDATVRFLTPEAARRFRPTRPLALLSNDEDDLFIAPGLLSVRRGGPGERIAQERGFVLDDKLSAPDSETAVYMGRRDAAGVQATLDVLRMVSESGDPSALASASLVFGFISHQKTLPANDPEPCGPVPTPVTGTGRGAGVHVRVLDTGMATGTAWPSAAKPAVRGRVDPLVGTNPPFLGRAAGHGTFVAGVVHQVAPDATILVHVVANPDGLVDELTLRATLDSIGHGDSPDIIVLPFGGYSVKLGSFGTAMPAAADPDAWFDLPELRAALERLVTRLPGTLLVASAGNNDSSDRCYPAAFSDDPSFCGHLVSVAALDDAGYRYAYSNYGTWVTASTLGVRIRSIYVGGPEHPANDPDGDADVFAPGGFAQWTGTSFAAPAVAGRIAEVLAALRAQFGAGVTATNAWAVVAGSSRPQQEGRCGVQVLVDGVAHD